ncbi:winged helix-turn-helix domain-containing protein [Streptosporangium sp. NBC_01495]|uniref:BTAD domain-containing putative transcriptional regulator n=1 Tax=Streptosporangium sp. NBC_01495 TaxID=2903899 RepID=UPI002E342E5D|nr:BTAD domain-containing putative transcriptional regulator [Streptosporangium sp. NBC_01495]
MRFGVLGPLAVWTTDGQPVRVPELKVRALLADLLAHRGRPVPADRLIDDLWGDKLPANPVAVLQTKVSQLRRVLEDAEPGGRELVASHPPGYLLWAGAEVDAERFETLLSRAHRTATPRAQAALLTEALSLWRGTAFADFADEEFARAAITRLAEQRLTALEQLAEARLELGEHNLLVGELGDLVAGHPLRERLRAAHMRALYRAGRQSEALETYTDLRVRLAGELGLDPAPELVALHQAILEQDQALNLEPLPAGQVRTNLPAQLTELVGRTEAVTRVRSLLGRERLVTLTGPGGVGKTRLALEAASQAADTFSDGVWVVELAALDRSVSVDGMAEVVAAVLGIRDDATGPRAAQGPVARLGGALRAKELLLLLDNCEHVVEPVAELAERLLKAAPGLHILATSQEPLELSGEFLQVVPPLEAPGPEAEMPPTALLEFGAVQLFAVRASAAAPGFALDAENAQAVAAICRRLDGIPLALELAATRVRALGVRELAARLDDRFRLLAAGRRDAPARQRTLRAMIDWSWELLTGSERVVLRRLAVHADGCTLEAAEQVCAGDGVPATGVLGILARLVDRSLVVVLNGADGLRYRLLESVAAYCSERMHEAGEFAIMKRRHGGYYAALAERAEPHLRGHEQNRWLRRLDAETANLRVALEHAAHDDDSELALRLVNALAWYWILRGRLGEGRRALASALALGHPADEAGSAEWGTAEAWLAGTTMLAGDGLNGAARGRTGSMHEAGPGALCGRARAEWFVAFAEIDFGELAASERKMSEALARFRTLDDRWGSAAALLGLAKQALVRGDLAALSRDGAQSLALFGELGDRWGQGQAADLLGMLAEVTGDYERARRLRADGLRMAEELGLWSEVSYRLSGLGRIALLTGDFAAAERLHLRAMRLAAEQSNRLAEEHAEIGLGLGARRQGRLAEAEAHLNRWLDWNRRIDPDNGTALILAELGFVAELRGDAEGALALHLEGHAAARATGDPRAIALALEGLAGARALAGHPGHAVRLLKAAAAARESVGAPLPEGERGDVDRITAATRGAMLDRLTDTIESLEGDLRFPARPAVPAGRAGLRRAWRWR